MGANVQAGAQILQMWSPACLLWAAGDDLQTRHVSAIKMQTVLAY